MALNNIQIPIPHPCSIAHVCPVHSKLFNRKRMLLLMCCNISVTNGVNKVKYPEMGCWSENDRPAVVQAAFDFSKGIMASFDGSHDMQHLIRVWRNATAISKVCYENHYYFWEGILDSKGPHKCLLSNLLYSVGHLWFKWGGQVSGWPLLSPAWCWRSQVQEVRARLFVR